MKKYRIVHLIPYNGIGGVESAASTFSFYEDQSVHFSVEFITKNPGAFKDQRQVKFRDIVKKIISLILHAPDVLIVSLWRSVLVGIILKTMRPKTKLIFFLHYPDNVHLVDRVVTAIAAKMSFQVWADSARTMEGRLPTIPKASSKVISFITKRVAPASVTKKCNPNFIFWGRLHSQKGVGVALEIFERICQKHSTATFSIIGPDGGEKENLKAKVSMLGIDNNVNFLGSMAFTDIVNEAANACFYLQTSSQEGMAMSVVEAMQLGLVPVVTPVGEIQNYCKHMDNSILIESVEGASEIIEKVLQDATLFGCLQKAAVDTWHDKPLYRDSMRQAILDLIGSV